MGLIIDCKEIANKILKICNKKRKEHNIELFNIKIFLLNEDEASKFYANNIKKDGIKRGYNVEVIKLNKNNYLDVIKKANEDKDVHGIMIQYPIPNIYDEKKILSLISGDKDIDGIGYTNALRLYTKKDGIFPATAQAVIKILEHINIDVGEKITVVGRSHIVGLPLLHLLLKNNYTPTICHSKTKDLKNIILNSNIVVSAIGRAHFFDDNWIKNDVIIIDVGTNFYNGRWVGDFNTERCIKNAKMITKVPGGVGTVTRACLYENMINCVIRQKYGK